MTKDSSVKIRENPWPSTSRASNPALVFVAIFAAIFLLHAPLLQLPYFWDEAGYYVAAARDLLLTGSLIPHTTVSNAHPPLVMAWVALWWKVRGLCAAGDALGHAGDRGLFTVGSIPSGRARREY